MIRDSMNPSTLMNPLCFSTAQQSIIDVPTESLTFQIDLVSSIYDMDQDREALRPNSATCCIAECEGSHFLHCTTALWRHVLFVRSARTLARARWRLLDGFILVLVVRLFSFIRG